jgi:S1-C subfamily serine protease
MFRQRLDKNLGMIKRVGALVAVIITAASLASAQQAQQSPMRQANAPWIVSVVHTLDVDKMLARMRERPNVRLGVAGATPQSIINVATGLVVDGQGHVVTRLSNIDPRDKDQKISVTTTDGVSLPARLVGVDCATGFAVLEVAALKLAPPEFSDPAATSNGMAVRIMSADAVARAASPDRGDQFYISHSIKVMHGQVRTDSIYSKARGALTLNAQSLLSRNDGSVVTNFSNQVVGIAQYAGYGRAYLFPIEFIRSTIAKRVLEKRDNVPAGWLGAVGETLTEVHSAELGVELDRRSGVIVRQVTPEGPAFKGGLMPKDVIVRVDEFDITGSADLTALLSSSPAGRNVRIRAIRNGSPLDIEIVLGARPLSWPIASPLPQGEYSLSDYDQVQRRRDELVEQYRSQQARAQSKERDEALRELRIEIRKLNDDLRAFGQDNAGQRDLRADFGTTEKPGASATAPAEVSFPTGFSARDLEAQLANYFGVAGGVLVTKVSPGSAAEAAGIKAGDVIVEAQDNKSVSCAQLQSLLAASRDGLTLKLVRQKEPLTITLTSK